MKFYDFLAAQERWLVLCVLKAANGNVSQAAFAMGIGHPTLFEKMKKLEIKADEFRKRKKGKPGRKPRAVKPKEYRQGTWLDHKMMLTLQALEASDWNRAEAARRLDISYRTIHKLIRELKLRGVEIHDRKH